jgi:hypothetical protein
MGNATTAIVSGFRVPPQVMDWSKWDTLATIGILLVMWELVWFICKLSD